MVAGDGVVVVVDGAGIPADLRRGCSHSVAWFARSVADTLHGRLVSRSTSMIDALAETIDLVKASHAATCDLIGGSPSATVAAWRVADDQLEYLVLCDASLVLIDDHGRSVEVTDHRLPRVLGSAGPAGTEASTAADLDQLRAARRAAVEAARNRPGGFWCVHTDASAATEAVHGVVAVTSLAGVLALSDGAARAYDLLGTHTLDEFSTQALSGQLQALSDTIRGTETNQAEDLRRQGLKVHDDLTIIAQPLTDTAAASSDVDPPGDSKRPGPICGSPGCG